MKQNPVYKAMIQYIKEHAFTEQQVLNATPIQIQTALGLSDEQMQFYVHYEPAIKDCLIREIQEADWDAKVDVVKPLVMPIFLAEFPKCKVKVDRSDTSNRIVAFYLDGGE